MALLADVHKPFIVCCFDFSVAQACICGVFQLCWPELAWGTIRHRIRRVHTAAWPGDFLLSEYLPRCVTVPWLFTLPIIHSLLVDVGAFEYCYSPLCSPHSWKRFLPELQIVVLSSYNSPPYWVWFFLIDSFWLICCIDLKSKWRGVYCLSTFALDSSLFWSEHKTCVTRIWTDLSVCLPVPLWGSYLWQQQCDNCVYIVLWR